MKASADVNIRYYDNDSQTGGLFMVLKGGEIMDVPQIGVPFTDVGLTPVIQDVDVTIEQLPLYPGALVSDGVDDYGQTAEAISEEVGTVLVHGDWLNPEMTKDEYILNTSPNNEGRLYLWKILTSGNMQLGGPPTNVVSPLMAFSRTPNAVQGTMTIGGYSTTSHVSCALYRLILIREQLDDAAVEFLKWKVDKEHRDWLKEKGWAA